MARVSARVSDESRRGWERATFAHGCTFSALVEALGLALDERGWDPPADVVERAQQIDRERFSRRS